MSLNAVIRIAPLYADENLRDPVLIRAGREFVQRGGMMLAPGAQVLIDHDKGRPVGSVIELIEWPDCEGRWLVARCNLTAPPDWLRPHHTKASYAFATLQRQTIRHWTRIIRGYASEVSILSPGTKPAEPMARVLLLERTDSSAARASSDRSAAGETVIHGGGIIRRRGGAILGVR